MDAAVKRKEVRAAEDEKQREAIEAEREARQINRAAKEPSRVWTPLGKKRRGHRATNRMLRKTSVMTSNGEPPVTFCLVVRDSNP